MSELVDTFLKYRQKITEWSESDSVHPLLQIFSKIVKTAALEELEGETNDTKET